MVVYLNFIFTIVFNLLEFVKPFITDVMYYTMGMNTRLTLLN